MGLSGCGQPARLTVAQGSGSAPELPAPQPSLVPTVRVASAVGWPAGAAPTPAPGLRVQAFASGLNHPRWLYTLPNGDVLVAESNAPAKPDQGFSLKAWVTGLVMSKAGAAVPSPDRILLLRDTDGDGVADTRSVFIAGLHSPLGMALVGSTLYIANTDAVVQVPYNAGETQISARPVQVMALPAGPINHHWTKNLIASADGRTLYITVGSNSNVAERGMAVEAGRAAIHALELATGQSRLFATGLRNPNGLAWVPAGSGQPAQLWTVVNERDELGSDLVPDYMTSVREGGFYGWPYSYFGQHVDSRVQPQRPELVASALVPDYALGPHTASLGLHWLASGPLAEQLGTGLAIGQHGSWNRDPPSGYRVVLVKFANGAAQGLPQVLLDGFLSADLQKAYGRPVGLAQDRQGALLVADDVGNTIWRLSPNPTRGARP